MSEVEKPASEETVVESMTEVFRKQNRVSVDDVVESMKSLARVRD